MIFKYTWKALHNIVHLKLLFKFLRYRQGHQSEADESTDLIFVELEKIRKWDFEDSFLKKLTSHCLGGLRLYHLLLKNWFEFISLEGKMSNENLHLSANKSSFVIMFLNLNFNLTYEDVH